MSDALLIRAGGKARSQRVLFHEGIGELNSTTLLSFRKEWIVLQTVTDMIAESK